MAAPGKRTLMFTVVDIGSWKISALIAAVKRGGRSWEVLGTGQRESRGVRRGFIADMERTEVAIRETVERAQRSPAAISRMLWVGFSGGNLVSDVVSVERVLGGYRVSSSPTSTICSISRGQHQPRRQGGAPCPARVLHDQRQ